MYVAKVVGTKEKTGRRTVLDCRSASELIRMVEEEPQVWPNLNLIQRFGLPANPVPESPAALSAATVTVVIQAAAGERKIDVIRLNMESTACRLYDNGRATCVHAGLLQFRYSSTHVRKSKSDALSVNCGRVSARCTSRCLACRSRRPQRSKEVAALRPMPLLDAAVPLCPSDRLFR